MSYADQDRYYRPRHETYSSRPRDSDPYSPRYAQPSNPPEKPTMRGNMNHYPSSSYYDSYDGREPRRSAAPSRYRSSTRKATWPPSPVVEDESDAASKEVSSSVGSEEGEPPINTRGTVDQEYLLDEVEQPKPLYDDEKRFAFAPGAVDNGLNAAPTADGARRRSFAERGNMPHLKTDVETDPPLFTKRVSTPYSYTPQKESVAPVSSGYMLSPEPITPANTSKPRTVSSRDAWDSQKDQNARPPQSIPVRPRRDSFPQAAPQSAREDVFDDSASEGESIAHLRTNERKPARYSFVKGDSHKEDLRAHLRETQSKPEPTRRDSTQRPPTGKLPSIATLLVVFCQQREEEVEAHACGYSLCQ
ncbi:hypothetical protein EJ07DRAFT_139098 [Lizonia empirigonia]|nr:hypothetical protein EJ07DRAFT_139098 [Lizonia empirigonia]